MVSLSSRMFDHAPAWNMTKLRWPVGDVFALGLMVGVWGSMVPYFWRTGWIGQC